MAVINSVFVKASKKWLMTLKNPLAYYTGIYYDQKKFNDLASGHNEKHQWYLKSHIKTIKSSMFDN